MKLIFKLCFVLLVLGLVLPMWLKDPAGAPIMRPADWLQLPTQLQGSLARVRQLLEQLPAAAEQGASLIEGEPLRSTETAEPGQFYRWQDAAGNWHFADRPPADSPATSVEKAALPTPANSLAATPSQVQLPAANSSGTGTASPLNSSITPPLPEGVSREAIEKMLEDAHQRRMGENL